MEASDCKQRAPRRKNFTDLECSMIIDEISRNREQYIGKFSSSVTKESKNYAWEHLTEKINAACGYGRGAKEIEKKWYNLQQSAVKEVGNFHKEMKKTGTVLSTSFHIQLLLQRIPKETSNGGGK